MSFIYSLDKKIGHSRLILIENFHWNWNKVNKKNAITDKSAMAKTHLCELVQNMQVIKTSKSSCM